MAKFKFNHEAEMTSEAIGVTEDFFKTLNEKYRKVAEKLQENTTEESMPTTSFITEQVYRAFDKEELAYLSATLLVDVFRYKHLLNRLGIEVEDCE